MKRLPYNGVDFTGCVVEEVFQHETDAGDVYERIVFTNGGYMETLIHWNSLNQELIALRKRVLELEGDDHDL